MANAHLNLILSSVILLLPLAQPAATAGQEGALPIQALPHLAVTQQAADAAERNYKAAMPPNMAEPFRAAVRSPGWRVAHTLHPK